jgi:hypothetical protein
VRIKRVDFVADITDSVYRRMESERKQVANELRSQGAAEGEKIRADADRQREVIIAEAYRDAQKIKGEGDAKASALYAEAFGRDPQFAQFYRSLEAYRASFRNKSRRDGAGPGQRVLQGHARRRRARRAGSRRQAVGRCTVGRLAARRAGADAGAGGLLPFFSPQAWRQVFERATRMSDGQIRFIGLSSMLPACCCCCSGAEPRSRAGRGGDALAGRMPFSTPVRFFMLSAWLLPEHIADVLPAEAARIEQLRARSLLDRARCYGFELVMPPLLEHLESLLSGTGRELDLKTFKLVDQLSGRTLGVRADTTPQAARIDAHLLNREGVTRLCYCGPVLHTRPQGLRATREPLQFGAEIFGHAGLEADLEAQELALDACARRRERLVIDLADARMLRGVLAGVPLDAAQLQDVVQALSEKDAPALAADAGLPEARAPRCWRCCGPVRRRRGAAPRAPSNCRDRPW